MGVPALRAAISKTAICDSKSFAVFAAATPIPTIGRVTAFVIVVPMLVRDAPTFCILLWKLFMDAWARSIALSMSPVSIKILPKAEPS